MTGTTYIEIVRWNGPVGNFTYVKQTTGTGCVEGDVLSASISGSNISVFKNGVLFTTGTDSTYASGGPGIGFYSWPDSNVTGYGFSSFTATDGLPDQLWSGVLDSARATDWTQAGISGGIPSGSWTQCVNTQCSTVTSAGTGVTPAQIATALSNAPANTYVLLGAGTYNFSSGINVTGANNVELRGAGPKLTKLVFTGVSTCPGGGATCGLSFGSSDTTFSGGSPTAYNWTAGYAQGATSITLANSTSIVVGTMLILDQCDTGYSGSSCAGTATDNGDYFVCGFAYNPTGPVGCSYNSYVGAARPIRYQQEMTRVVSCSPSCNTAGSTVITISTPLQHPNWASGQTPQAWFIQPSVNVGVRNLSLDGNALTGTTQFGVSFYNLANYWMQNVTLTNWSAITLWIRQCMYGDVESNYVYNAGQSSPSTDNSAFNVFGSDNLFANNIFQNAHLGYIVNGPASGNVFIGNTMLNAYTGNGTLFGMIWPGHSEGSDFDLYEQNIFPDMVMDDAHGSGLSDTMYRNLASGWESCANGNCGSDTAKNSNLFGFLDEAFWRYHNYVANIAGTPGVSTVGYTFTNAEYFRFGTTGYPWSLGSGNTTSPGSGGTAGGPIPIDTLVASTVMRWGNWDSFNAATRWNTGEVPSGIAVYPNPVPTSTCTSLLACPASFYYSGRPSWWAISIPFPAIGTDVNGGNVGQCTGTLNVAGHYAGLPATSSGQCTGTSLTSAWGGHINAIPSFACYLSLGGAPDGTGSAIAFDAAVCYASNSPSANLQGSVKAAGAVVLK